MSLVETRTPPELKAHYKAVHARIWMIRRPPLTTEIPLPEPPPPPPQPDPVEDIASRRREIDERLFGALVTPKTVISVTASYFGLPVDVLCGSCRKENIAKARQAAIYLMSTLCRQRRWDGFGISLVKLSTSQIGHHFRRDHTTVIHSIRRVRRRIEDDEKYATAISEIMTLLHRSEKK